MDIHIRFLINGVMSWITVRGGQEKTPRK